ncbi:MAG: DUF2127 domain-containing protein [Rubrivivax sp.]
MALFEAAKGLGALAVGLGLRTLVHRQLARHRCQPHRHCRMEPDAHYPAMPLHFVDIFTEAKKVPALLVVAAYVTVRLSEAWRLWFQRSRGERLGAVSGALYLPLEVRHLLLKQTWYSALILSFNAAVVAHLSWRGYADLNHRDDRHPFTSQWAGGATFLLQPAH